VTRKRFLSIFILHFGVLALSVACNNSPSSAPQMAQNSSTQAVSTVASPTTPATTPQTTSAAVNESTSTPITTEFTEEVVRPPINASPGEIWIRPDDMMTMVYAPINTFQMGSTSDQINQVLQECAGESGCYRSLFNVEAPAHTVSLDGFWIDQTEVTNAQFSAFLNVNGNQVDHDETWARTTAENSDSRILQRDTLFEPIEGYVDHPVTRVSWYGAAAYCRWVNGQLPTEAQWEYAARGPNGSIYPWGNNPPNPQLLNYDSNVRDSTPVGSYPDGGSWIGTLDMADNVDEWVNDWFDLGIGETILDDNEYSPYYSNSPTENPTGPETGIFKVLRGSGWPHLAHQVRTTFRAYAIPYDHLLGGGFRCVITVPTSEK
jgi:formylglycine-generating enzyme required for sulfatase activity